MTTPAPAHRIMRGVELLSEGVLLALAQPVGASTVASGTSAPLIPEAPTYEQGFEEGYARRGRELEAHAQRELEQAFAAAAEAGRREGYAVGLEDARVAAVASLRDECTQRESEWKERLQALHRLTAAMTESFDAILDAAEDELVCLCLDVVARILGAQLASVAGIHAMVRQIRATRRGGPPFSIALLHPADHALLCSTLESEVIGLEWRPDPAVGCGGVILRHDHGCLDARLEVQLQAIQDGLRAERAARQLLRGLER